MAEGGVRDETNVCQLCGALDNLSLCGGCRDTWYCSRSHQHQDWDHHKRVCKKTKAGTTPRKPASGQDMPNESASGDSVDVDCVVAGDSSLPASPLKVVAEDSPVNSSRVVEQVKTEGVNKNSTESGDKADEKSVCDQNQAQENSVVSGKHKHSKARRKKNKHHAQGNLITNSEESHAERYYLNYSTHSISLPRSATSTSGSLQSAAMGQGDNKLSALQTRDQYLTVLRSRFTVLAKYVVDCLTKYGICVIDKFLGDVTGHEILKEVNQLSSAGVMKQGQLVHGPSSSSNRYIRGDMITWVDGTEPRSENIHFLISCMDAVMLQCASKLDMYTINERTKAMVACYPGKRARYVRHVDNPNGDGRCITCIYYLNKDWDVRQHGGLLRIYPEGSDRVANIEPKFDRLLFFWSDRRNPHEVEESFRERYAITVWYYDAEERAQALKKFKGVSGSDSNKTQAVPLINGTSNSSLSE